MANKKHAERRLAWLEYLHYERTQEDIAKTLGVSQKTVSEWAREDNWKEKREAIKGGDEAEFLRISAYIAAIHEAIATREKKFPTKEETDILSKLISTRAHLNKRIMLPQLYEASMKILDYVKTRNLTMAKGLAPMLDEMLKEEAAKLNA